MGGYVYHPCKCTRRQNFPPNPWHRITRSQQPSCDVSPNPPRTHTCARMSQPSVHPGLCGAVHRGLLQGLQGGPLRPAARRLRHVRSCPMRSCLLEHGSRSPPPPTHHPTDIQTPASRSPLPLPAPSHSDHAPAKSINHRTKADMGGYERSPAARHHLRAAGHHGPRPARLAAGDRGARKHTPRPPPHGAVRSSFLPACLPAYLASISRSWPQSIGSEF